MCIFEARRQRKGRLKNSQYNIFLPSSDVRLRPVGGLELTNDELEASLYCGKVRNHRLSDDNLGPTLSPTP